MGGSARGFGVVRFKLLIPVLCGLLVPATGHAFKMDTHVWIGQQVLNDVVPDGRLTINGREYPVSQQVWRALAENPSQYRMGNIGPDAFPDLLAGQLAIHPGARDAKNEKVAGESPPRWQADDWFRWLLSSTQGDPERTAFAYGYLGHAAGDIFAHTYVNTYAGDVFWLTKDGKPAEQEVELRHFTLESYIAKHNPPLRDHRGTDLGPASGVVAAPAAFIRDRLIFNDDVKAQYEKGGFTKHLAAMWGLTEAVRRARDKIDEIDGITIPRELARLIGRQADLQARIDQLLSDIERFQNDILVKGSLINVNLQLIEVKRALIQAKIEEINALSELLNSIQSEIERRNSIVADFQNQLANTVKETCNNICRNTPPGCGGFPRPPCVPFCELICELTSAWIEINNRLQQAVLERDAILAEFNAKLFEKTVAEQTRDAAELAIAALEAENRILQEQINLARDLLAQAQAAREQARADLLAVLDEIARTRQVRAIHVLAIRTMLEHWHRDLGLATEAYVVAWGDFSRKVMDGTNDPDGAGLTPLQPLTQWLDCWGTVYAGLPKEIPGSVCRVKQSIDVVKDAIQKFKDDLGNLAWLVDPAGELQELVLEELEPTMVDAAFQVADKIGGQNLADAVGVFYFGANRDTLNQVFAGDSSGKNLLLIPDIAQRIDADMHLTADGRFDPEQYRVVRNAVVLAKLTLLDQASLNQIVFDNVPGTTSTVYGHGPVLYPEITTPENVFNILIGAVQSIDGNQQWQQLGLPYLRAGNFRDDVWPWTDPSPVDPQNQRSYGYGFGGGNTGFRFWEDRDISDVLFRNQATALFKGPLAPAIEYPQEFGLSRIIRRDYPFRACPQNPFPRTTDFEGTFVTDAANVRRDNGCDEDLTVTVVPTLAPGDRLLVDFTIANEGADRASPSQVSFYFSTEATLGALDVPFDQRVVPALQAGATHSGTVRQRLPSILPGTYYIIAVVDPNGQVAEAREDNNTFVSPIAIP